MSRPAAGAAVATFAFIALSVWWLAVDKRTPGGGDPADPLATALRIGDLLRAGDLGGIFDVGYDPNTDRFYPPLVQLVGGIAPALHLEPIQDWGEVAINLVFVPMLAAGTYLVGKRVYGPTAGLLAAVFALGTPMVLSLFHVFLLDAPLAATVAIALAALIASERFYDRRASVIAGALIGLAMLVKTIAPLYLAGPILVMLLGGGWRQWRNLAFAAAALLVVAGPYYLAHLNEVVDVGEASTVGSEIGATGTAFDRDARISVDNLTWYGWAAINEQYFVPLLALFAVGFVAALRELRTRAGVSELLAGIVVTYFALPVVLSLRDPRYTLPLVVFVAVIATGWIATTPRAVFRRIGLAVLGVAVAANVAVSITGRIPVLRLEAPGTNFEFGIDPGSFTILDDTGYWVGPPETNPLWRDLFAAAERNGLDTMRLYTRQQPLFWGVDYKGLDVFGVPYGVREVTVNAPRPWPAADVHVTIWTDDAEFVGRRGFAEPCGHIEEGASLLNGEPVNTSVLVERRTAGGYVRWCEF
jgi:hypothetical protein